LLPALLGDTFDLVPLGGDGDTEAFLAAILRLAAGDLDFDLAIFSRLKFNKKIYKIKDPCIKWSRSFVFIFRFTDIFEKEIFKTDAVLKA
jgi:hypothetical protein